MIDQHTEYIWKEFNGKLKGFIAKRVNDPTLVDDILQEVFLKIHTNLDHLNNLAKLKGWIYRIARNAIIDYYRSHRITSELPENLAEPEDNSRLNASQKLAGSLKEMIKLLPPQYREALLLTEFGGMKQADLAKKLGISLSGAKSRVQRGRRMLKDLLYQCCHFEFDRRGMVIDYHPISCCCCSQTC
jgi:RNA polymerase sigma-70 factor (ECF subfamily)